MALTTDISEQLQLFLERAHELEGFRFYQNRNRWEVVFDVPEASSFPDDQDFRAFLTCFRQFFLKREPVYLETIWDHALTLFDDTERRPFVEENRRRGRAYRASLFKFRVGDTEYNPSEVFDLYIYSQIFHNDHEKRKVLSELSPGAKAMWRASVLQFVNCAVQEIAYLKAVVHVILEETPQVEIALSAK